MFNLNVQKSGDDFIISTPYGFNITVPAADIAKISISHGNKKMGLIPSVSLPAIVTCNAAAPCARPGSLCYAQGMERNLLHNSVIKSYYKNLLLWMTDPASYFMQVKAAAAVSAFFRYHVSGDIPGPEYFQYMIDAARDIPHCQFLAFTKQYKIVNNYIDAGGIIPDNLHVIYSSWFNWKCNNPHNLPVCEIVKDISTVPDNVYKCGGSCSNCCAARAGCFLAKNGDIIAIQEH